MTTRRRVDRADLPTTTYKRVNNYLRQHETLTVDSTIGELLAALGADIIAGQTGLNLTPKETDE